MDGGLRGKPFLQMVDILPVDSIESNYGLKGMVRLTIPCLFYLGYFSIGYFLINY